MCNIQSFKCNTKLHYHHCPDIVHWCVYCMWDINNLDSSRFFCLSTGTWLYPNQVGLPKFNQFQLNGQIWLVVCMVTLYGVIKRMASHRVVAWVMSYSIMTMSSYIVLRCLRLKSNLNFFLSIYVVCGTFQCHSLYCSFMWNVTIDSLVNHSIIDICGLYYSILPFCFRILVNVCSILYIYLTSLSTLRPELPFNANASVNEAQKNLIERDCRFIHFSMAFSFFYLTLIYINCLLHHYHHHLFLLLGNCFRLRND